MKSIQDNEQEIDHLEACTQNSEKAPTALPRPISSRFRAEELRLIARITCVGTIIAIIVSLLLPKWYRAETSLLPPQQNSSLATALLSQLGNMGSLAALSGGSLGLKNPADLYVSLLRSRTVEDAMIKRFSLTSEYREKTLVDTRKRFESLTTVAASTRDGLIRISVEAHDPTRAAAMANAYVEELRKLSSTLAITEAAQRRLFFEQQLEDAKNQLAAAENALKQTQLSTGLIQVDSQARAMIESAAAIRAQVAAKQVQIQAMQSFATTANPEYQLATQQLAALQAQLDQLTGSKSTTGDDLFVPKGKVPEAGLEYFRKYREVKYRETLFELLAEQLELAKLDEARQGAIIQVVDPAVVPDKKSFPPRLVLVLFGATLSFGFSLLWIFRLQQGFAFLKGTLGFHRG